MPDLVTHAAVACVAGGLRRRDGEALPFLLFGAMVPDIGPAVYIPLLDVFDRMRLPFPPEAAIWYFQPWHTPLAALLWSGVAVALFASDAVRALFWSAVGVLTHFGLDGFQRHIGFHMLLAYPFAYGNYAPSLWFSDHPVFRVFSLVSVVGLPWLLVRGGLSRWRPRWRAGPLRACLAALGLAVLLVMPLATKEAFYANDVHSLRFFRDPASREGEPLAICVARVVSDDPWTVRELGRLIRFEPPAGMEVRVGDQVSFEGIYRGGVVAVERWHVHRGLWWKRWASVLGLGMVAVFLVPWRRRRRATVGGGCDGLSECAEEP